MLLRPPTGFQAGRQTSAAAPCKARRAWQPRAVLQALPRNQQQVDVVALGNLCLDVVIPVAELPPQEPGLRKRLLSELTLASQDDTSNWEVGGSCNFIIAAARLGLKVSSVGHLGLDIYGEFMAEVLQSESISSIERIVEQPALSGSHADVDQTLVCFVLVDPNSNHAFCSRYDFGPWPLLSGVSTPPSNALKALESTRAVYLNGFVFDELPLEFVRHTCNHAINHGAAVFFDPGPRCFTMMEGERRQALDEIINLSEVVLMTEEESVTVTGHSDPEAAARAILSRPGSRTRWAVVKLGAEGAVLVNRHSNKTFHVPGLKVDVQDTVGCGDSFAAAVVQGYIHGCSEEATLCLANAVGAATATGRGAGRNVAAASKVAALLTDLSKVGSPKQKQLAQEALRMMQITPAGISS